MNLLIYAIIGSILIGYFIGCINISYIFTKIKGKDIRTVGSGNAGASNMVIVFGKKAGIIVALIDIFKAVIAVSLAGYLFDYAVYGNVNYAKLIAGAFSIVGHIAPFYMGFKGGKGLAALGGTVLAMDYRLFIVMLALAIVVAVLTDYICFVPVTAVVAFPLLYGFITKSWVPIVIFILPTILVWYRHMENFRRIKEGTELRFHFLWNSKSESERLGFENDRKKMFHSDSEHGNTLKK